MRIAIWYNLPSGGGKRALYDQVQGLKKRGHDLEIWCPPTADRSYLKFSHLIKENVVGLKLSKKEPGSFLVRLINLLFIKNKFRELDKHARECANLIINGKADILLAHSCMFMGAPFIGRYVDLPKVLYIHEPYRSIYEAAGLNPWTAIDSPHALAEYITFPGRFIKDARRCRQRRIHIREETANARAFDYILVNSIFSRESLLRAYGLNSTVCYLGIDLERFKPQKVAKNYQVINIGGLVSSKRQAFIIQAMSHLSPPRPELVCVANVVDPGYREQLMSLAEKKNVKVRILHNITDEQLCEIISQSRLLAYAPRLEPFGYAPLEANACEIPVVAVAEGGVRETVLDGVNGLLVNDDPQEMAQAMKRLLSDENYARELGRNGRCLVEDKWELTKSIVRLEDTLTNAISKKPYA